MKAKKINKKLVIKKETIAQIDDSRLNDIKGGATANTCYRSCLGTLCFC